MPKLPTQLPEHALPKLVQPPLPPMALVQHPVPPLQPLQHSVEALLSDTFPHDCGCRAALATATFL